MGLHQSYLEFIKNNQLDTESRTSLQSMRLTGGSHIMSTSYLQKLTTDMTKSATAFGKTRSSYRKTGKDYVNKKPLTHRNLGAGIRVRSLSNFKKQPADDEPKVLFNNQKEGGVQYTEKINSALRMLETQDKKRQNLLTIAEENSVDGDHLTGAVELDQFHKIIRLFGLHVFLNPSQTK